MEATRTTMWERSIASDVSSVKTTFSGWDQCMTKAYCKWPAIVGIIIGALILLSLLWCLFRCLCCGAECCCGCLSCLSCCKSCCSSGRNRSRGYEPTAPAPQHQPYMQYQSAPPPIYSNQPQYAQFDTSKSGPQVYNEDALPVMPSWDNSRTTRRPAQNDVEMGQLDHNAAQAAPMLPKPSAYPQEYPYQVNGGVNSGDLGVMGRGATQDWQQSPAHQNNYGYEQPARQNVASPYSAPYGGNAQAQRYDAGGYEASVAPPPSYRTAPLSVMSPSVARKPVQNTWRDI